MSDAIVLSSLDMMSQGQPIGGKGKLTDLRIKKLTNYYGRAIKDSRGDLTAMQDAVWAMTRTTTQSAPRVVSHGASTREHSLMAFLHLITLSSPSRSSRVCSQACVRATGRPTTPEQMP